MEIKKIEALLKKYLEGETSLSEESFLRDYFNKEIDLPEAFKSYQKFFTYYQVAKKETFPLIKKKTKLILRPWMFAAASIAIIFSLQISGFFTTSNSNDQEEALKIFKQFQIQMKQVSSHLNNGSQSLAYLDYWNNTTQKLIK